jgi:hypothetical protein
MTPAPPVSAYRNLPSADTVASTVPASVAVLPSAVRLPLPLSRYAETVPLPAFDA